MTLPRSRPVQAAILLVTCGVMASFPLINHSRNAATNRDTSWFAATVNGRQAELTNLPTGRNKDYPLWYATGRAFLAGDEYYPPSAGTVFPFMYPPFAALLLGLLAQFGPDLMVVALVLLNVVSLAVAVELSVRLAAGTPDVSLWLRLIPSAIVLFFVSDMFLLGQPNLGLLGLVLGGLMLVRAGREVGGGVLLAAAAAIKAFPAVVIVYLVWRRHWRAAASMAAFTALFLVPLPATVRGWDRAVVELKRWADGMIFTQRNEGFGQRPEQSLGFKNQSLFGVGHRLLRPVNVYVEDTEVVDGKAVSLRELRVNVLNLDHKQALVGIVLLGGLLGLAFVAVMPPRAARTRTTDALEFGILTMLVTVCTPYAYSYYFVWLIYPLTVMVQHGLNGPTRFDRQLAWATVAVVTVSLLAGARAPEPAWLLDLSTLMMAVGAQFWGALAAAVGCGWALLREGRAKA